MSSSVQQPSPEFDKIKSRWQSCRDVIEGKDAVHSAKEAYLPRLTNQTDPEYKAYQLRAGWYGATDRTKQVLKGMIFRKEPQVNIDSELMSDFVKDATLDGVSIANLSSMLIDEILETGRAGLLVDHQRKPDKKLTKAEAEDMNLRPYIQLYRAEQMLGHRTSTINNKRVVTQIRLLESIEEQSVDDEFTTEKKSRVRVLELVDGVYQQRIFEQQGEGEFIIKGGPITPRKNGKTFNYIPFWFVGVQDLDPDYDKPPLMDLAELNLDYYRTKADYKHGLHFTGLPTAVITGHKNDQKSEYRIGSSTAWVFSEAEADAKYLEFTGQGLSELREELKELKNDMATLGARMLATEKRQVESAEAHTIKRSGEHSLLASIANNASQALEYATTEAADWSGVTTVEIGISLNTDFLPIEMSTKEVLELWTVVQGGGILYDDFIWNLRQGERLNPNIDDDERKSSLQTQPPTS